MRAIRTPSTNGTLELAGAGPEHDLPIKRGYAAGPDGLVAPGDPAYHLPYVATVWEPSHEERAHLAIGRNLQLLIITPASVPPLAMGVTDETPVDDEAAHAQPPIDTPAVWMALDAIVVRDVITLIAALEDRAAAALEEPDVALEPEFVDSLGRLTDLRVRLAGYVDELDVLLAEPPDEDEEPTP
jgi:hypothetical protein